MFDIIAYFLMVINVYHAFYYTFNFKVFKGMLRNGYKLSY